MCTITNYTRVFYYSTAFSNQHSFKNLIDMFLYVVFEIQMYKNYTKKIRKHEIWKDNKNNHNKQTNKQICFPTIKYCPSQQRVNSLLLRSWEVRGPWFPMSQIHRTEVQNWHCIFPDCLRRLSLFRQLLRNNGLQSLVYLRKVFVCTMHSLRPSEDTYTISNSSLSMSDSCIL